MYAEQIAASVRTVCPDVEIRGYRDYGFETHDLAVMGFFAVLKKLFYFLRVKRTLERAIDTWRPDVVCTVDYPGLNLKLAAYAKSKGVRAVHVVCPQVWAWKAGRIPKIEASLDKLCCFFPFEPSLFKPGFAEFVGHPLVDAMKEGLGGSEGSGGAKKTLAILPGSRAGEIERNLPVLLEVVGILAAEFGKGLGFVIPAANQNAFDQIVSILHSYRTKTIVCPPPGVSEIECAVETKLGGARETLRSADAAVVASGTATLEAALANCPTVLVYDLNPLLGWLLRRLIKGVRHVGLANIIAEKAGAECPMPELLLKDFTAENVLKHVRPWLLERAKNAEAREMLAKTMKLLQSDGNSIAKITQFLV